MNWHFRRSLPIAAGLRGVARLLLREGQFLLIRRDDDGFALVEVAPKNRFRERVLEVTLDGAAQRTGAELLVVTVVDKEGERCWLQDDVDVLGGDAFDDLGDLELDNLDHVLL